MKKYQVGGTLDPVTGLTEESESIPEIKIAKPRKRKSIDILKSFDVSLIDPKLEKQSRISKYTKPVDLGVKDVESYYKYLGEDVSFLHGDLDKRRALAQGKLESFVKNAVNLPFNVGLGIIENAGYLLELPKAIVGDRKDFDNSITKWAKEQRNPFGEVYRVNPDKVIDFSDSAWWMENGFGLIESIGEFIVTGAGVGKLTGSLARMITKNLGKTATQIGQGAARWGTASSLAYVEGAMSGAVIFEQTYDKTLKELLQQGLDRTTAHDKAVLKASGAAVHTVQLNTVFNTFLNASALSPLFKGVRDINKAQKLGLNRAKGPTGKAESSVEYLKRLQNKMGKMEIPGQSNFYKYLGFEMVQESLEELINVWAEGEGRIAGGIDEAVGSSLDRMIKTTTTEEGQLSMVLGALGGAGQTGGMHIIPYNKRAKRGKDNSPLKDDKGNFQYEWVSRRTLLKEDEGREYDNFVTSLVDDIENISRIQKEIKIAAQEGKLNEVEQLKWELFNIAQTKSILDGSSNELIGTFEEIAALSPEEAVQQGLAPNLNSALDETREDNYKVLAKKAIINIEKHSRAWEDILNRNDYGDEEVLGLGKYVFQVYLKGEELSELSNNMRERVAKLRAELDENNKLEIDIIGAFDMQVELQTLNKALTENDRKLAQIKELKKSKEGRRKLTQKFKVYRVNNLEQAIERNSKELHAEISEKEKEFEEMIKEFSEKEENKGKSKNEIKELFIAGFNANASTAAAISSYAATAKLAEKQRILLGEEFEKLQTPVGRDNFVKEAKKDLEVRKEKARQTTKNAKRKETREARTNKFNEAESRTGASETAPRPEDPDVEETVKNAEEADVEAGTEEEAKKEKGNAVDESIEDLAKGIEGEELSMAIPIISPYTGRTYQAGTPVDSEEEFQRNIAIQEKVFELIKRLGEEGTINPSDFSAVSRRMQEVLGPDRFQGIYDRFNFLYAAAINEPSVQEITYDDLFPRNADEDFVNVEKTASRDLFGDEDGQTHGLNPIQAAELFDHLNKNLGVVDGKTVSNGLVIGIGDLIIPAGSAMAWLARDYEKVMFEGVSGTIYSKLSDTSTELSKSIEEATKGLMSPNKYQVGEEVILVIDENYNETVENEEGEKVQVTIDDFTDENGKIINIDEVPIAVMDSKGIKIAYLHKQSWITSEKVAENPIGNIDSQKRINKAIREAVVKKRKTGIKTKIESHSYGKLIWTAFKDKKPVERRVSEAFPDENLQIIVGRKGLPFKGLDEEYEIPGDLINPPPKDSEEFSFIAGAVYAIVPTPVKGKHIALFINPISLEENPGYSESMANAIEIFLTFKDTKTLSEEQGDVVDQIKSMSNIDILSPEGIKEYIKLFTHIAYLRKDDRQKIATLGPEERTGKFYLDISEEGNLLWQEEGIGGYTIRTLKDFHKGDGTQTVKELLVEKLNKRRMSMRLSSFKDPIFRLPVISNDNTVQDANNGGSYRDFIKNNTKTPLASFNIGTKQAPEWTYFIQPVITMNYSFTGEKPREAVDLFDLGGEPPAKGPKSATIAGTTVTLDDTKLPPDPDAPLPPTGEEQKPGTPTAPEVVKKLSAEDQEALKFYTELNASQRENPDFYLDKRYAKGKELARLVAQEKATEEAPADLFDLEAKPPLFDDEGNIIEDMGIAIPITEKEEKVLDASLKGILIPGFTAYKQQQVIWGVNKFIIDSLVKNLEKEKKDLELPEAYETVRQDIQNLYDKISEKSPLKARYKEVLDNWEDIVNISKTSLRVLGLTSDKKLADPEQLGSDPTLEEATLAEIESMFERTNYDDALTFMIDPKQNMSSKLKRFLSFIPTSTNYLGWVTYKPYNQVSHYLNAQLSGVDATDEAFLNALKEDVPRNPWVQNLIDIWEDKKTGRDVKNQLLMAYSSHQARFKTHLWEMRPVKEIINNEWRIVKVDGNIVYKYFSRVIDTNQNSIAKVIEKQWYENIKDIPLNVVKVNPQDPSQLIINPETAKLLIKEFDEIAKLATKGATPELMTRLQSWLTSMGVELSDGVLDEIRANSKSKRVFGATFKSLFIERGGVFKVMADRLKDSEKTDSKDNSLDANNPLTDNSGITKLAQLEAKYNDYYFSNSFRNGENKTIFAYSQNKALSHSMKDLKADNSRMLDLAKLSYTKVDRNKQELITFSNTLWGQELLTKNSKFKDIFGLSYIDTSRQRQASGKGVPLKKMPEKTLELMKLAFFQNQGITHEASKRQISHFFFPTPSDKTTVPIITALKHEITIRYDKEGNLRITSFDGKGSLDELWRIVQAEATRIRSFHERKRKAKEEGIEYLGEKIKDYAEGAERFHIFPELNNRLKFPKLWGEDGFQGTDEEVRGIIEEYLEDYVLNLIEAKKQKWLEQGIIKEVVTRKKRTIEGKEVEVAVIHQKQVLFDTVYVNGEGKLKGIFHKGSERVPINMQQQTVNYGAADFVINSLIANANQMQLFAGDPAFFYKADIKSEKKLAKNLDKTVDELTEQDLSTWHQNIHDTTWANISKRIAKEIAPGLDIPHSIGKKYNTIFLEEILVDSQILSRIEKLLGKKHAIKFYEGIKSTDAQEYTTATEHVNLLYWMGKITEEQYEKYIKIIKNKKDFSSADLEVLFQPMKPVYVKNIIDEQNDIARPVYIKSSSFPLLPQLTRNLEIDKLRLIMEGKTGNDIERAAYGTATKLGASDLVDWRSSKVTPESALNNSTVLSREGLRMQQEIPHDPFKAEITKGSQEGVLLFINFLEVPDFKLPWKKDPLSGSDLLEMYTEIHSELYDIGRESLLTEMGVKKEEDGSFTFDKKAMEKLRDLLRKEAANRGWSLGDIQSLSLTNKDLESFFTIPLWALNNSDKVESLLTSIVSARVTKLKMPGYSAVLGSSAGMQTQEAAVEDLQKNANTIVYLEGYDSKQPLKPMRPDPKTGRILPAQVLAPFNFKDNRGNPIGLDEVTLKDKDGKPIKGERGGLILDPSKMSSQLLKSFGFRIPSQALSSMSFVEIVGFLPEAMGDLIIAPAEFVAQMGSDFDVDKLYSYIYNTTSEYSKDGVLQKLIKFSPKPGEKGYSRKKVLQNQLLDIHFSVLSNPRDIVQKSIMEANNYGRLPDLKDEISAMRKKRDIAEGKLPIIGISDEYQTKMFYAGRAGQTGIAVFSTDSIFNAVSQGKNLGLVRKIQTESGETITVPDPIVFGIKEGDTVKRIEAHKLSPTTSITDPEKFVSQIIEAFQSTSVDNANEQILNELNINSVTFAILTAMNLLGFDERYSIFFINQDIIIDYIKELENLSDPTNKNFISDPKAVALENIQNKYLAKIIDLEALKETGEGQDILKKAMNPNVPITLEEMKIALAEGESSPNYALIQLQLLSKFAKIAAVGDHIQNIKFAINTYSKHLGKSLIEVDYKWDRVELLDEDYEGSIENVSSLIGTYAKVKGETVITPQTINGHATMSGLQTSKDLWDRFFLYNKKAVNVQMTEIELIIGERGWTEKTTDLRRDISNNIKSFLFSSDLGLWEANDAANLDSTLKEERARLLMDVSVLEDKVEIKEGKEVKVQHRIIKSKSLATRVEELKKTQVGKRNPLIKLFTTVLDPTGKLPSILKFDATKAANLDDAELQRAWLELIKNPETRDIGQDLVTYSYITGGIQGAINFVKYTPFGYLYLTQFPKRMREISKKLEDPKILGISPESDFKPYYDLGNFTIQYFQHFPDKAPRIQRELVTRNKIPVEFTLDFAESPTLENMLVPRVGNPNLVPPELLSITDSSSKKGFRLFRLVKVTDKEGHYVQISTAGSEGKTGFIITEYNPLNEDTAGIIQSLYPSNNVKGQKQISITREREPEKIGEDVKNPISGDILLSKYGLVEKGNPVQTKNGTGLPIIKGTLAVIAQEGSSEGHRFLAPLLATALENINPTIDIDVTGINPLTKKKLPSGIGASYVVPQKGETGIIVINKYASSVLTSPATLEEAILHEILHAITAEALYPYEKHSIKTKNIASGIKKVYRTLQDKLKNNELAGNTLEGVALTKENYEAWVKGRKIIEDVQSGKRKRPSNYSDLIRTHNKGLRVFYSFTSVDEFVTGAMTNKEFQDILNHIEYTKEQSIFEYLVEQISKLIIQFRTESGEKIEKGSALEAAVKSVIQATLALGAEPKAPPKTTPDVAAQPEGGAVQYYEGDITPDKDTIFVFGSNPVGINGNPARGTGGAALVASTKFGVKQGEKMDNKMSDSLNAYGLTTVTYPGKKRSMTPAQITEGIKKLYTLAQTGNFNKRRKFKIAYKNTDKASLNGYTGLEMIDMFNAAGPIPSNVIFSKEWFDTGKLNLSTTPAEDVAIDIDTLGGFKVGDRVSHPKWGKGIVTKLNPKADTATIEFDDAATTSKGKKALRSMAVSGLSKETPPTAPTKTIKPTIDLSKEWIGDLISRPVYTTEGINTMRTLGAISTEHFGNPFSEADNFGTIKVDSIGDAVIAYKDWLLGNKYKNVKPEQRKWILDQINQGKLDGATLLYAHKSAARGQGMHPTALAEVVEELRRKQPTAPTSSFDDQLRNEYQDAQINIYFKTGENAELSNFAERPFKLNEEFIQELIDGNILVSEYNIAGFRAQTFNTVENAFQAIKGFFSEVAEGEEHSSHNMTIIQKIISLKTTPAEAKKLGRKLKGLDIINWDKNSSTIMKSLIESSFKQNPKALAALAATGQTTLTHTQDKSKWGKEFPRILMEVRNELGIEPTTPPWEEEAPGEKTPPPTPSPAAQPRNEMVFNDGTIIPTGNITLNEDQERALASMGDFVKNKFGEGNQTFGLKGYAGTGKTTIMDVLRKYIRRSTFTNIKFSSPTHRANAVLRQVLDKKGTSSNEVYTLHSLFGLGPQMSLEKFDSRSAKYVNDRAMKLQKGDILIIDESSMINNALYDFIVNFSKKNSTQVIFVGDPKQLKPVKQTTLSKAFSAVDHVEELTIVERTGDNPLLAETVKVRTSKEGEPFSKVTAVNSKGEGVVFTDDISEFLGKATRLFSSPEFKENPLLVRIVAGTNKVVVAMNETIRRGIWGEREENQYNVGEILMGYGNWNVDYQTKLPQIMNGGDYMVTRVEQKEKGLMIEGELVSYKGYELTIQNLINTGMDPVRVFMLDNNTSKDNIFVLADEYERLREVAIDFRKGSREAAAAWAALSNWESKFAFTKDIVDVEGRVKIPHTIKYGYAHTIHKSQGGTYENVFVHDKSIMESFRHDYELRKQLKYVAISRASKLATIFTTLSAEEADPSPEKQPTELDPTIPDNFAANNAWDVDALPDLPPELQMAIRKQDPYEQQKKAALNKYILKKNSYWKDGKKFRDSKTFTQNKAQFLARKINNEYPLVSAIVHSTEKGMAIIEVTLNPYHELNMAISVEDQEAMEKIGIVEKVIRYKLGMISNINRTFPKFKDDAAKTSELEARKEKLEKEIEVLRKENLVSDVLNYAEEEMKVMEKYLQQVDINEGDITFLINKLETVRSSVAFWLDANKDMFTTTERRPVGTETIRGEEVPIYGIDVERMNNIISTAQNMEIRVKDITRKIFLDKANQTIGINQLYEDKLEIKNIELFKDTGVFTLQGLDISRGGNLINMVVHKWMKDAQARTNDEAAAIIEEMEGIVNKIQNNSLFKSEGWKLFAQTDENGDLTGSLVTRFSQAYYDERGKIFRHAKEIAKDPSKSSETKKRAWEKYFNWSRENEIILDPRKLYHEEYKNEEGDPIFTEKNKKEHLKELEEILGKEGLEISLETARELYKKYKEAEEASIIRIEGEQTDPAKQMKEIDAWKSKNSPFVYTKSREEGTPIKVDGRFVTSQGAKYIIRVPRKTVKGKETKWYDSKFKEIEENPDLMEFYLFFTGTVNTLLDYIPDIFTDNLQINTIPEIQQNLLEQIFSDPSLKNGFIGLHDAVINAITHAEDSEESRKARDPVSKKEILTPRVSMLPSDRSKVARRERAKTKSYQLDKVLKAFAMMALGYKHKSRIEDGIRLARRVLEEAEEKKKTPSGKRKKGAFGELFSTKGELERTKKQLDYAIESFYGIGRPIQGAMATKRYTWKEKQRKKQLEEQLGNLEKQRETDEIPEAAYETAKAELEAELEGLGKHLAASRVGDVILKYVQLKGMGWNVFSAITNMIFGGISDFVYANGRKEFDMNDMVKAFAIMLPTMGKNLSLGYADMGLTKKIKTLMVKYNVLKEFNEEAHSSTENSNRGKKGLWKLMPYELQRSSEYFVQGMEMVAFMLATKVNPEDENSPSLWEAYDEDGDWKTDQFDTKTNKDWNGDPDLESDNVKRYEWRHNLDQVLKATHGNYDPDSAVLIKKVWVGRAMAQFRSWVAEGWATRFEDEKLDLYMGRKRKGRYRTYADLGILKSLTTLLKQITYRKNAFDDMNELDVENMRKNLVEIMAYISLLTLGATLKALAADDDDDDEINLYNFWINQAFRIQNDISFFVSPIAMENITKNFMPVFGLVYDITYFSEGVTRWIMDDDLIKQGPNAGESRLMRGTGRLLPFTNQMYRLKTSEETLFQK